MVDLLTVADRYRKAARTAAQICVAGADPNGRITYDSMLDMQAWYVNNKMTRAARARTPGEPSYVRAADQEAPGPFVLENKDSQLPRLPVTVP